MDKTTPERKRSLTIRKSLARLGRRRTRRFWKDGCMQDECMLDDEGKKPSGVDAQGAALLQLPEVVLKGALSWLDIHSLGVLDAACTNWRSRRFFIQCLNDLGAWMEPTEDTYPYHTVTQGMIQWLSARSLHLEKIRAHVQKPDLETKTCIEAFKHLEALSMSVDREIEDPYVACMISTGGDNLRCLELRGCHTISIESLMLIGKRYHRLESMVLSDVNLTTTRSPHITWNSKGLKFLRLSSVRMNIDMLFSIISQCTDFHSLSLQYLCGVHPTRLSRDEYRNHYSELVTVKEFRIYVHDNIVSSLIRRMQGLEVVQIFTYSFYDTLCMDDDDVLHLALHSPNLRVLEIDCCRTINDDVMVKLLYYCPQLTTLRLSFCDRLTDRVLHAIESFSVNLQELICYKAPQMTDDAVTRCKNQLSDLKVVIVR